MTARALPRQPRPWVLWTSVGTMVVAVAALDLWLPRGYNAAYLYVPAILISGLARSQRHVIGLTLATLALTVSAYWIKEPSADLPTSALLFNRVGALVVIALSGAVIVAAIARALENVRIAAELATAARSREWDRRMLAAASDVAPIGTWSIAKRGNAVNWSREAAKIHGHEDARAATLDQIYAMLSPEQADTLAQGIESAWQGQAFGCEFTFTLADGSQRQVIKAGEPVDRDGEVIAIHGTVQDVTSWREAQQRADELSHRFAKFAEIMPIVIWTANPRGEIEYFNDQLLADSGRQADDYLKDAWVNLIDERDRDRVAAAWGECVRTGAPYDVEFRSQGRDGGLEWHHETAMPERDKAGNIVRWWGSKVNITGNRALLSRNEQLATEREHILESMLDGVYAVDRDWRVIYVNSTAEALLGHSREELVGTVIWDLYPGSIGSPIHQRFERAMRNRSVERFVNHSAVIDRWLDLSVTPTPDGLTVFFRDITEVKRLTEQLAQSQRLESVGRLTGGIAHDFNNVLTVVLGGADALAGDPSVTGEAADTAELVVAAAQRGAELTNRLLAFARKQPLQPRALDPRSVLMGIEPLLRRTLGETVDLSVVAADNLPAIEADPSQLENALLNLVINARDAMPNGGKLTVEASEVDLDQEYVTSHAEVESGRYVVLAVSDSGTGIAPELLDNLFDPFFTTKPVGMGSGLGLAMVWGFVKQSRGHITVYSELGYGASFKMYLPLSDADAPSRMAAETPTKAAPSGSGIVLLAEDDELVRTFAAAQLRNHGYTVVEAGSGPEALAALRDIPQLDLLFTDVIMPGGMTGRELAEAVTEQRPGTPVLYASGYTENVIVHNGRLDPGVELLAKPYSARLLLTRVSEITSPDRSVRS